MYPITQHELKERLNYDKSTGIFTWRDTKSRHIKNGATAGGAPSSGGYIRIKLFGCLFLAHRLAWLYEYGEMPSGILDHRDRVRTNNRIDNLRVANRTQNGWNRTVSVVSSSGLKGVTFVENTWRANITIAKGRRLHLGSFATAELAHDAFVKATEIYHGEFACDGKAPEMNQKAG